MAWKKRSRSKLETDRHILRRSIASQLVFSLDRFPLWLWIVLSLAGYMGLALWFPLLPNYNRVPLADIRTLAPSLAEGLIYGGLVCLLFAFFALAYRRVLKGGEKLGIAGLVGISFLFSLPLLLVYPINANDVYRYVIRGRIQTVYGENPFSIAPDSFPEDPFLPLAGEWAGATSPYGPVWELTASTITRVTNDSLLLGLLSFKLLGSLAFAATAVLLWMLFSPNGKSEGEANRDDTSSRAASTLLWAWNPALLFIFVVNGHNDALMIFWLMLGVYFIGRKNVKIGFLLMMLGVLVKPIGVLALPLFFVSIWRAQLSLARRLGFLLLTAAGGMLLAAISFMPFGSPLELGQRLVMEAAAGAGFSPATMYILIGQELGYAVSLEAVARVTLLLFGLLLLWLLWRTWRGRSAVRGTADIYFGYLLQALNFRIWYAVWPFPWLLLDAGTQQRQPHVDFRLRYGLWFLLTTQLSVILYGHIRVYLLGGSQLLAHIFGVSFVFVLPFFLALWHESGGSKGTTERVI
jgi:hypothetical protein